MGTEPAAKAPKLIPSLKLVSVGLVDELKQMKPSPILYGLLTLFTFMLVSRYLVSIPVIIQMITYTIPIIIAGSFFALNNRIELLEESGPTAAVEVISKQDALLFPLLASGALGLIYIAFKYLSAYWVNVVLSLHICGAGCYAIGLTVTELWHILQPRSQAVQAVFNYHFPRPLRWLCGDSVQLELSAAHLLGLLAGLIISFGWLLTKAWFFHNLFAICFSVHAIRLISVGTFKTATILLCGLFVYDVFWVFETDVMVTVAKSFDAPAKLLFPTNAVKMGLLGLGDIVIPGIFIAMTLRFDYHRHVENHGAVDRSMKGMYRQFSKFYFKSSMVAYASSLCLTGAIMLLWQTAQPALLYLVPSLLVSVYAPALIRGELSALLAYSEEKSEEEEEEEDEEEEGEEKTPAAVAETEECIARRHRF